MKKSFYKSGAASIERPTQLSPIINKNKIP
jgi:hypothetical protein